MYFLFFFWWLLNCFQNILLENFCKILCIYCLKYWMTYDLNEFCWIEFKINDFTLSFSRSLYLELLRVVAMSKWCVCCLLYFHLKVMNGFRVEIWFLSFEERIRQKSISTWCDNELLFRNYKVFIRIPGVYHVVL